MNIPAAANAFGVIGAACWSIQLIPQIIFNFRRKDVQGLEPAFMMVWALAGVPLAVHNIVLDLNIALKIQPQILTTLSLTTWAQCRYYGSKWPVRKCVAVIAPLLALMAGVEVAAIIAIRQAIHRGHMWPASLMGVLAGTMLCAGVGCEYYGIWRHRTVDGISFLFCAIDAAGDVTSIISVVFEPTVNFYSIGLYAAEFIFWCGIFICGFYFKVLPWAKRKIRAIRKSRGQGQEQICELQDFDAPSSVTTRPHSPRNNTEAAIAAGLQSAARQSSTSVFRIASAKASASASEPNLPRHRTPMHERLSADM